MGTLFKGEIAIALRLIDTQCPIVQTNNAGEMAFDFAALVGRTNIMPLLVSNGADLEHVENRGLTPLQIALSQGNAAATDALRQAGATR